MSQTAYVTHSGSNLQTDRQENISLERHIDSKTHIDIQIETHTWTDRQLDKHK